MSRRPHAMPSLMKAQRAQEARDKAKREAKAKAIAAKKGQGLPHVPHCAMCGSFPAPFGFGDFSDGRPGAVYACPDIECRAAAEAKAGQSGAHPK